MLILAPDPTAEALADPGAVGVADDGSEVEAAIPAVASPGMSPDPGAQAAPQQMVMGPGIPVPHVQRQNGAGDGCHHIGHGVPGGVSVVPDGACRGRATAQVHFHEGVRCFRPSARQAFGALHVHSHSHCASISETESALHPPLEGRVGQGQQPQHQQVECSLHSQLSRQRRPFRKYCVSLSSGEVR